ncbi:FecR/PupR family sigma factor regulator [Bradyrhizobium sp.]|uniref:FecR/PupR family sigma factor regulator n=1 Tax=Bradyrhizobium sp. TaxID=376 RepID=UPI0025BE6A8B|nr:DUF4880 domain-containing protein [Bradyrhizobium sp.]
MTKRINHRDRADPLTREAAAWIVRLKSGEATLEDAEQLIDWRARSPAHEHAFRSAVKCWRAIGPELVNPKLTKQPPGRPRRKSKATSPS